MIRAATDVEIWGLTQGQWDVVGSVSTAGALLIGAVAALVGALQYRHSKQTQLDQSRPYVLITAEPSPVSRHVIDIVVQNLGAGPARDVKIRVSPPLKRVNPAGPELSNARIFTDVTPMLPPGFRMNMFFDSAIERHDADIPEQHNVAIEYSDGHGHSWRESTVLDLSMQAGMTYTEQFNIHHAAKALREIAKILKGAKNLSGEIDVATESRDERLQRQRRRVEEMEARMAEFELRQQAASESPSGEANGEPS